MLALLCAVFSTTWGQTTTTYIFGDHKDFKDWSTTYSEHTLVYDFAEVKFNSANKQSSTATITDCPVTKGQPVSLVMNEGYTLSEVTFECKQWGTKAQTITLYYSTDGGENYSSTEVKSTNFTISSNNLPSGTNAVQIRFSNGNQIGISSAKITFESASSTTLAAPTFTPMPAEGTTFTSAQTITITNNAESGSIVYYTIDGSSPNSSSSEYKTPVKLTETTTLKAIAIKGDEKSDVTSVKYTINIPDVATINSISPTSVSVNDQGKFTLDLTSNSNNYILSWSSSDGNLLTVDNEGNYEAKETEGSVTITVTAVSSNEDYYKTVSKEFIVSISDPNKPGTENNPYTVAQALEFIGTLGDNSSEVVYVKGIISQIDNINTTNYYNATYWISDDGTTTQQLQVYRGYYFENINEGHFTSDDLISVGDEVTIKGKLKKYNNTPEFDTGSYIVDQKGKEVIATDVTISPTKININEEGTFTTTVTAADGIIANDYTVSYLCNASDFIVDESTGEYMAGSTTGTFNVSVTVAPTQEKSDTYKSFSKTFEVTVVDPNANDGSLEKPYTVAEVKQLYSANNSIELADKYVTGYIAGCFKNNDFSQTATDVNSNIALSDVEDENDPSNIIPVQLPNNSIVRDALNLKDNDNLNMKVVVKGTIKKYFSQAGINPTTDAYIYTTITSAGYSTLYFNTALEVPEGITAYAVKVNGNDLTYTPVASPIPANTGVVLKGSGEQRFHVTATTNSISDNNLLGFNKTSVTIGPSGETTGYIFYMLSGGENGVGFYFARKDADGADIAYEDQEGQAFKSAAHKAYLAVEDNGSTTVSSFVFDDFTDISTVKTETKTPEGIYSITGVRMDGEHLPAGLYIVNGKKVIIR